LGKENSISLSKGPAPLQREIIRKRKMGWGSFKNFLLKNYLAGKAEMYMKAF
jgi:hypothetical protein